MTDFGWRPSRRQVLAGSLGGAALFAAGPWPALAADGVREVRLETGPAEAQIAPQPAPPTRIWSFNGMLPGPEIRVRQGERLRVSVSNTLEEHTTVHWHGIRLPNAMDGVPHLTQTPIAPGGRFVYEFDAVDAGTFWYHPHFRSSEQVGRGLYGPLIIEETEPPRVDRDITWVLDDWRLARSAQITQDFGQFHDITHAGRIGNTVTINGTIPGSFKVRRGERIRLRLINAANARNFALDLGAHAPVVVALDGQPVEPHTPADGLVTLGPAMRVDLILDMMEPAGSRTTVIDRFYQGRDYRLIDFAYADEPLRDAPPDWPLTLPANPLSEPELASATRHEITFSGGMMSGMRGAEVNGEWTDIRAMMRSGLAWAINGVAAHGHVMEPMVTMKRGTTHILDMVNQSAFPHPIHLHGHHFRVLSRNGEPIPRKPWQDTVLMAPEDRVEVAFVADNPGDWMFHCHIPEHMEAGMMGVIRVA